MSEIISSTHTLKRYHCLSASGAYYIIEIPFFMSVTLMEE